MGVKNCGITGKIVFILPIFKECIMSQSFDKERIKEILKPILISAYQAEISETDLRKNTLDVFSATLESVIKGISFDEWLEQEKKRQIQKNLTKSSWRIAPKDFGYFDRRTRFRGWRCGRY